MSSSSAKSIPSPETIIGMTLPFLITAYLAAVLVLRAWVIVKLWNWYLIPAFSMTPLRVVYSYGMCLIVSEFVHRYRSDDSEFKWVKLTTPLLAPFFTLLCGWIGTFWI